MAKLNPLVTLVSGSIFRKLAVVLALCVFVLLEAVIFLGYRVSEGMALRELKSFAASFSTDLAAKVRNPVRFGDTEEVGRLVTGFSEVAGDRAGAVIVIAGDGSELYSLGDFQGLPLPEMSETPGETLRVDVDAARFIEVIPVMTSDGASQIGTIGLLWSAETVLAGVWSQSLQIQLIGLALFAGVIGLMSLVIKRIVTRPLGEVGTTLKAIVEGDLGRSIPCLHRADELGHMAEDIQHAQGRLIEGKDLEREREADQARALEEQKSQQSVVEELRTGLAALSQKDLTHRITAEFDVRYDALRTDFNQSLDTLGEVIESVGHDALTVQTGASEMSSATDSLAQRTESQAAALEETTAALSEITQSLEDSAKKAQSVEAIVSDAQDQTIASDAVVKEAVEAMAEIKSSSDEISGIVGLIDDIAFQTNLLALNAGVEAARAGDAGSGFAVVANEVRTLAQRSAEASSQIKSLIAASSEQVASGVELVNRTGQSLGQVADGMLQAAGLVSEIAALSSDQATGISEIYSGVEQLDRITQENAAMVEQSSAASHLLTQRATDLSKKISEFHLQDARGRAAAAESTSFGLTG